MGDYSIEDVGNNYCNFPGNVEKKRRGYLHFFNGLKCFPFLTLPVVVFKSKHASNDVLSYGLL